MSSRTYSLGMPTTGEPTTRDRLMDAGMKLFADRGFRATRVEDIEVAVGLQPRRGGMYKHFTSKRALLEAAVERHLQEMATAAEQVRALNASPVASASDDELRPLLRVLGQWFLGEVDRQHDLTRILEHEGGALGALVEVVHERIIDVGYAAAAALLEPVASDGTDTAATAVALLGSLAAARRTAWTFGATPLGVTDERLLDAWSDLCVAWREAQRSPGHSNAGSAKATRRRRK